MKNKRLYQSLAPIFIAGFIFSGNVAAEELWYNCTIDSVGSQKISVGNKTLVGPVLQLDEVGGAFLDKQFIFGGNRKIQSQMLATAFAAASGGFQVRILTDLDDGNDPSRINGINMVTP